LLLPILIELVSNILGLNILDVVFVLLHEIKVGEEKLLETVKVDALGRFTEEIVRAEEVVHLFLLEVDFAAHEVRLHKSVFGDVSETCEVEGSVCVLRTRVHLVELLAQYVPDFSAQLCLLNAKNKRSVIIILMLTFYCRAD
jgi:hypothetical protein